MTQDTLKIMIVEDSLIMSKKLTNILIDLGYEVVFIATDGQTAIDAYPRVKPDIVTMDITMPELNGIETTLALRTLDPQAIIIMVTSHGQEQMIFDAITAGAKGYVLKPVRPEALKEIITTALAG